jgi:CheY-like chemotaxis protein
MAKKIKGEVERIRVLVVDDDNDVRKSLIEYLISFGFSDYREAVGGDTALRILKEEHIDLVISDWEMPGMTGMELLQNMRQMDKYRHTPFIIVTSPVSKERYKVETAAAAHVDGYIIKPFRSRVLKEKIEGLLPALTAARQMGSRDLVLVVDDDAGVRDTMGEYLKEMGYTRVIFASDGEQGFALAKTHVNELAFILSDWEMPRMAGIDLLKRIRSDAELLHMPFIMITSQASIERIKIQQAIEQEVDHYLLKPVRIKDLRSKVGEVLDKAKVSLEFASEMRNAEMALTRLAYKDAESAYRKALKLMPQSAEAQCGLANSLFSRDPGDGDCAEQAIQALKQGVRVQPSHEGCYLLMATIFEQVRSLEKAIQTLQEGLIHCSLSERMHFQMGRLLLLRARKEEACQNLERALELKPDFTEAKDLLDEIKSRKKARRTG